MKPVIFMLAAAVLALSACSGVYPGYGGAPGGASSGFTMGGRTQ